MIGSTGLLHHWSRIQSAVRNLTREGVRNVASDVRAWYFTPTPSLDPRLQEDWSPSGSFAATGLPLFDSKKVLNPGLLQRCDSNLMIHEVPPSTSYHFQEASAIQLCVTLPGRIPLVFPPRQQEADESCLLITLSPSSTHHEGRFPSSSLHA